MSGHNKVYGFCENKCRVEVFPNVEQEPQTLVSKEIKTGKLIENGTTYYVRKTILEKDISELIYNSSGGYYELELPLNKNYAAFNRINCVVIMTNFSPFQTIKEQITKVMTVQEGSQPEKLRIYHDEFTGSYEYFKFKIHIEHFRAY